MRQRKTDRAAIQRDSERGGRLYWCWGEEGVIAGKGAVINLSLSPV